ncbi:MAG: hypothetical protein WC057_06720 [Dehalococcoidales bacterium]
MMDSHRKRVRIRLRDDYRYYARHCLWIRTKSGSIEPFVLNSAQEYLHSRIEEQRARTGRVRAIILKGRQQGCSTYVEGRYYWRVTHRRGVRAFILTHEDPATQNLFEMVKRFHNNCLPAVRPSAGVDNAKELTFDKLDCGYKVGTAKTKGTGRSSTIQFFHGSEVAFWSNADTHAAGIFQAIPDEKDTEVILESTANGMGNFFHQAWQDASAGRSEFIDVFIPWYWQAEYRKAVPEGFVLSPEEGEYMDAYGLDLEQMAWRRAKIVELKDPLLFKQEYPATPAEAFQVTGEETLIASECVLRARKYATNEAHGPVIVGFDPDAGGKDGASSIYRKGRVAFNLTRYRGNDAMAHVGAAKVMLDDNDPYVDMMFIDGSADGVISRLWEMGYRRRVRAVNFGGAALAPQKYKNKRNEIWGLMNDWLNDELPVSIPDDDTLHAQLVSVRFKYDSNHNRVMESKEAMRQRGIHSPNDADALALTFAEPVRSVSESDTMQHSNAPKPSGSYWSDRR